MDGRVTFPSQPRPPFFLRPRGIRPWWEASQTEMAQGQPKDYNHRHLNWTLPQQSNTLDRRKY
eukprot:scaffold142600_cov23-Cyclotella_meneghiniana.AAC.1